METGNLSVAPPMEPQAFALQELAGPAEHVLNADGQTTPAFRSARNPIELRVELGRTELSIQHILEMRKGCIVRLENAADEPIELYVQGRLRARGELVVHNEHFGMRITELVEE